MKKSNRFTFLVTLVFISLAAVLLATIFLGHTKNSYAAAQLDVCATCTYTTIQDAIEAANNDDIIRVAEGTYTGMMSSSEVTATVILTKNLTLMGGFNSDFSQRDPDVHITTIDTQGNTWGGVCICGSQSIVDGFHIINADGGGVAITDNQGITAVGTVTNNRIANNRIVTDTQLNEGGAGIDIVNGADATIANNEIVSNTIERSGTYGGGIRIVSATAKIYGNIIAYNLTYSDTVGGGIDAYLSTVVITGNNIHHNANMGIGIYRSVAEVVSNTIDSNTTVFGGGGIDINSESTFTLTGNIISNNQAQQYDGGGIGVFGGSEGVISQNQIVGNHAVSHGGGIGTYDNGQLDINHNNIQLNTAQYGGGGIHISGDRDEDDQPLAIEYNTIYSNTSEYNAGINVSGMDAVALISGNDIRFNQVTGVDYQAGGININDMGAMVTVVNNIVAHNDNRGIKGVNYTEIKLINNTIVGNGSQAIEMHAWPISSTIPMTATVINNIIADHPDCAFSGFFNAVFAVHNNDVVGHDPDDCGAVIISQSDNINTDPLFSDEINGDYHLTSVSPVIDNGRMGFDIPVVDIEGNDRPQGNGVDMGAYEAVHHQIFLPIVIKPTESSNVALGKAVELTTNGADDPYVGSGLSPADITDGNMEYTAVSSSQEDGVIGFVNNDYAQEMEVSVTIDLGGTYDITSIRYNMGNVQFANYWYPDVMISPFQTTSAVPGTTYNGAWTEHTGTATLSTVTVTFKITRDSFYEDWFFIGEIEVYGTPAP